MLFLLNAAGHDAASREFADDVVAALKRANLSQKIAALTMGMSETQFAGALAGRQHLSLWRLSKLPPEFQKALWTIRLARIGCEVLEPGHLLELVNAVKARVLPVRPESA